MTALETSSSHDNKINLFDTIHPKIKKSLLIQGITSPTAIQEQSYEPILNGDDIIAQSRTGSGKTIAFGLGAFTKLGYSGVKEPRLLVLTPTRELADQIAKVFNETFQVLGFRTLAITGGKSYRFQKSVLTKGVDAIVATPGRFCDLLDQNALSLENLEILVLDEMDEMLDFGFSEDILRIKKAIGKKVQTLLFSATFPGKVEAIVKQMVKDPVKIAVSPKDVSTGSIEHEFIEARMGKSTDALLGLLLYYNPDHAIIFCRTREETKNVSATLSAHGFAAGVLNGEMSQKDRSDTMERFKRKSIHLLLATDVAARGIDISGLSHVINLNVPGNTDTYTHRAGRTGRAGATGKAWTIVVYNQRREYQTICSRLKISPKRLTLPNPKQMMETLLQNKLVDLRQRAKTTSHFVKKAVEEYANSLSATDAFTVLKDILTSEMQVMIGQFPGSESIIPAQFTEFGENLKFKDDTRRDEGGRGRRSSSKRGPRNFENDKFSGKRKFERNSKSSKSESAFHGKKSSKQSTRQASFDKKRPQNSFKKSKKFSSSRMG